MEGTRLTELFMSRLLIAAACFALPAGTQFQPPLPGQQFVYSVPSSVPSFVYYKDTKVPENLFSPINTDYKDFRTNRKLRDDVQTPVIPGSLPLGNIPSNGFVLPDSNGYGSSINNRFLPQTIGISNPVDNSFILPNNIPYNPALNNANFPPNNIGYNSPINNGFLLSNNPGFNLQTSNKFAPPYNNAFNNQIGNRFKPPTYNTYPSINSGIVSPSANGLSSSVNTNEFLSPNRQTKSLSEEVSLLRYASNFPQTTNQPGTYNKAVIDLNPTVQQRQRDIANAGQLLYRQRSLGSKPFLTSDPDSVQRDGGEVLPSSEGFLGQPYRRPTFVSAVGTPVSGVGQNPLYTGDSVQASTLDETSDVRGVKSAAGIPAPGRLPVSQDAFFAGSGLGYANNFGYSVYERPAFSAFPPPLVTSRGPLAIGPAAYQGGFVNG